MDNAILLKKFTRLPENLKVEVADFIDFMLLKAEKSKNTPKAKFGSAKGMFKMNSDFDEPLDDFKEYM